MSRPLAYEPPAFGFPVDLDLSKNEGRAGTASLLASIEDPQRLIGLYPDTSGLRARIATLHGVSEQSVLVTAGGDDALSRCFTALVGPGRLVISTDPTFEMIPRYAGQRGAKLLEVPWGDGAFPAVEVISSITDDTDAVFIVSPNNPTGSVATEADLRKVAAEAPFLVLDAAYVEFADADPTPAALEMGNVVVVRTMSKAYGLAGLRVGYLLGPPGLVADIGSYGSPYPVSALSAALAETRLDRPEDELADFIQEVKGEREELVGVLSDLGTRPLPSQANFVLTACNDPDWVVSASASLGIGLRRFPGRARLEQEVRITVPGDSNDFDRLVRTLGSVLRPETIVFDLDGVLADVSESQIAAIIETARSFGVEVTVADIGTAKAGGGTNDDWALTCRLCQARGVEAPIDQVTDRFESIYQGSAGKPGLKESERPLVDAATWERWGQRLPLAVVTGRPRSDAVEFLERFGLMGAVSALITREDGPLKPDPAPVAKALEVLGVTGGWMVGDTPDDLVAARRAGLVPIGVIAPGDEPGRARERLRLAARVLDKTTEVEGLMT